MNCIFCDSPPTPDNPFSTEHVVPEALGGSLTIDCVCRSCNSVLGSGADDTLVNHRLSEHMRFLLRIRGKTGKIPNPYGGLNTFVDKPSLKVRLKDTGDGLQPELKTNVHTREEDDATHYSVTVDAKRAHELPGIVEKIALRRGFEPPPAKEIMDRATTTRHEHPTIRVSGSFDLVRFQRGLLKIAFEYFHYCREQGLVSGEPIDAIVPAILHSELPPVDEDYFSLFDLVGGAVVYSDEVYKSTRPCFDLCTKSTSDHVLILAQMGPAIVCMVRVFSMFVCHLVVSQRGELANREGLVSTVVNPVARRARTRTLSDLIVEKHEDADEMNRLYSLFRK